MGTIRNTIKGIEEIQASTISMRILVIFLGMMLALEASAQGLPFTENFSGDTFKDDTATTADWDTATGVLRLPLTTSASPVQTLNNVLLPSAASAAVDAGDEAKTRSVAVGDFDGDGFPDLAFANDGLNTIYYNDGAGGFVAGSPIPDDFSNGNSRSAAAEDFNGDGFIDVVIAEFGGGQATRIHFNNGSRSSQAFTAGEFVDLGPTDLKGDSVQAGDIDGDGDADVVLGNRGSYVQVFRNDGFGIFGDPEPVIDTVSEGGFHARSVMLGDLDGDGDLDIVAVREYDDARVYMNNGGGDFTTLSPQSVGAGLINNINSPDSSTLGDVNGDGLLDLIIGNDGSNAGLPNSPGGRPNRLFLNSGNASDVFPAVSFEFGDNLFTNAARLADVDRDGDLDLVTADSAAPNNGSPEEFPANNHLYVNDPVANAPNIFPSTGAIVTGDVLTTKSVEIADLDRDGALDLVFVQQQDNNPPSTSGVNLVVLNAGTLSGTTADQVYATSQSLTVNNPGDNLSSGMVVTVDILNDDGNHVFDYWLSDDGGISWWLAHAGASVDFTDPVGADLRWRVEINSPSPALRPSINSLGLSISRIPRFQSTPVTDASQGVLYTYDITTRDNDPDDLTDIRAATPLPAWLTLTDNNDGTAVLTGTPTNLDVGPVDISLEVRDTGNRSDTQDFTITVADTPDAPIIVNPIGDQTFLQGDTVNIDVTGVFSDPDMDPLTYSASGLPASLMLDGVTGMLSGTLTAADVGGSPYAVGVTADDGNGGSVTDNFMLTITDVPDAPTIDSTPVTSATEGVAYTYNIMANDPDPGAQLTISVPTVPGWLNFADNGDGTATLTGTPGAANVGANSVIVRVTDNDGMTAEQSFTISVAAIPPPPPPPPPPSGGGGSASLLTLLALLAVLLRRRRPVSC